MCTPSPETVAVSMARVPTCSTPLSTFQRTESMPELSSSPLSSTEYAPWRQAVEAVGEVLRGLVGSRRTVWAAHGEALPATSMMRDSTTCSPVPVTTAVPVSPTAESATPSTFHSTLATPEPGATSVPWTETFREVWESHALVGLVTSTGSVVSILISWSSHGVTWFWESVKRTCRVWMPSPVTVTGTGPAPATSPESASSGIRHSMRVTPEPEVSVAAMLTLTDGAVRYQPTGAPVVASSGPAESTCTLRVVQPESLPTLSSTRVLSVWAPLAVMSITSPLLAGVTAPLSTW